MQHPVRNRIQGGFTYLGLLLVVAVLGIGLTAASEVWVTSARRQKLAELEWVGNQFVQAIGSYYYAMPGKQAYPKGVDDLLLDRRYAVVRRHLRVVYANPFTGKVDWEFIVGPGGGIRGIRVQLGAAGGVAQFREYVHTGVAGANGQSP